MGTGDGGGCSGVEVGILVDIRIEMYVVSCGSLLYPLQRFPPKGKVFTDRVPSFILFAASNQHATCFQ